MRGKLSVVGALALVVASVVVTYVPYKLGAYFGFGAILVTPVVMAFLLFGFGAVIALTMPAGRWLGVALATLVMAAISAVVPGIVDRCRLQAPAKIMYVVLPPAGGLAFPEALAKLLKGRGVEAELAQSLPVDDDDRTILRGLSATKGAVYIISYNTQMSGYARGYPSNQCLPAGADPIPDPDQYLIMMQASLPCAGKVHAAALFDDLRRDLVAHGYEVRDRPVACAKVAHKPVRQP